MSGIDLSFVSGKEKFNYRVCAVIISEGKLLAMHDERSPYYYLPGGRVQMGETAEAAVAREVQEELAVTPEIIRPLWLNQAFFTEGCGRPALPRAVSVLPDGHFPHGFAVQR